MEEKSLFERYGDEALTDNAALKHYEQCRGCRFRDKTAVQGVECGWNKCYCQIYEKPEAKPPEVYKNIEPCEYYEPEKGKFEK